MSALNTGRPFFTPTMIRSALRRPTSANSIRRTHSRDRSSLAWIRCNGFYPAEAYHQDYLIHNPTQPYIAMYDLPKIENFRRTFPELYSGHAGAGAQLGR